MASMETSSTTSAMGYYFQAYWLYQSESYGNLNYMSFGSVATVYAMSDVKTPRQLTAEQIWKDRMKKPFSPPC